jgi:hypothetical protein
MENHASFSPSSLERVAECPGSHARIAALPPELRLCTDSEASLRGTRLHGVLANRVSVRIGLDADPRWEEPPPGSEDAAALSRIWSYVDQHPALQSGPGRAVWVEQRVEIGRWCGLPEGDLWGTADLILATRRCWRSRMPSSAHTPCRQMPCSCVPTR